MNCLIWVPTDCAHKDSTVNTFHADGSTTEFTIDFNANPVNEFEVFVGGKRHAKVQFSV